MNEKNSPGSLLHSKKTDSPFQSKANSPNRSLAGTLNRSSDASPLIIKGNSELQIQSKESPENSLIMHSSENKARNLET